MLSISFLDLAHNALNSIGFLKGNLWVSYNILIVLESMLICPHNKEQLQFFGGVLFFGFIIKFIPEPNFSLPADPNEKKVGMNSP